MKNKKGTHVGIILSFVIFVTFLVFISTVIKPASTVEEGKKYTIDLLKNNLLNIIDKEIKIVSVVSDSASGGENCLVVSDEFPSLDFGATNVQGEVISSQRSGDIYLDWAGEPLVKIYYSSGLETYGSPNSADCMLASVKNIRTTKEILEKDIIEIISNYSSNYSSMKAYLGVPPNDEFNIDFDYLNGTIVGNSTRNLRQDIYVESFQINYLDYYAEKKIGELKIYAW